MEILFISHKYPPTIGGMEKQCYELITHCANHCKVHRIVHIATDENKAMFFLQLKSRVKKYLAKHPTINVIHLNDGLMGLVAAWLKSYTDIPVVVTIHGLDVVHPNKQYQSQIKKKLPLFDQLICVSQSTANECLQRGIPKNKISVVQNGVDHDLVDFKFDRENAIQFLEKNHGVNVRNKKIIITLGRPVKRKGFSWFLENVVPTLREDVVVLMIGPFKKQKQSIVKKLLPTKIGNSIELAKGGLNDQGTIAELMKREDINDKVIQVGKLPFDQLLSMLHLADIFAMPNIKVAGDIEGFGLVALEAALCKTIVLASAIEGITDAIIDEQNGYLLPSKDANAWAQKIQNIFNNSKSQQSIAESFRDYTLEHYSWNKMTQGYLKVFEQVASDEVVVV